MGSLPAVKQKASVGPCWPICGISKKHDLRLVEAVPFNLQILSIYSSLRWVNVHQLLKQHSTKQAPYTLSRLKAIQIISLLIQGSAEMVTAGGRQFPTGSAGNEVADRWRGWRNSVSSPASCYHSEDGLFEWVLIRAHLSSLVPPALGQSLNPMVSNTTFIRAVHEHTAYDWPEETSGCWPASEYDVRRVRLTFNHCGWRCALVVLWTRHAQYSCTISVSGWCYRIVK